MFSVTALHMQFGMGVFLFKCRAPRFAPPCRIRHGLWERTFNRRTSKF